MRRLGLRGVMRGKVVRTTISDARAPCPLDRVNRPFRAQRLQFAVLVGRQLHPVHAFQDGAYTANFNDSED